jgi:hypothetical protein
MGTLQQKVIHHYIHTHTHFIIQLCLHFPEYRTFHMVEYPEQEKYYTQE